MNHAMDETLHNAQLAYLGRLLSAFTHELKNHLAIINESSGLMGDLIELGRLQDAETSRKFQKSITSIAERIDLANTLVKNLNSFGHRMDKPVAAFSINDILREEIALMNKFARMKAAEIDLDLQEDIPSVTGNPALLQFLVYIFIDAFLDGAQKGDTITIATGKQNGDVTFRLEENKRNPEKPVQETDQPDFPLVSQIAEKLGVRFHESSGTTGRTYLLTLPAS